MPLLVVLAALLFLMVAAYRGFSVILFAPAAALLAVLFTDPSAGLTGSASGGLSIALASMAAANTAGIPMEVLHRVASMASGGMDTLPHNGAVITLLAVTGLKTLAGLFVIALYYSTDLV